MAVYIIRWSPVQGDDMTRTARNSKGAAKAAFHLVNYDLTLNPDDRSGLLKAISTWVLMPPPKPHLTLEWYHAIGNVGVFTIRCDHGNGKPGALRYRAHERHRSWRKK